MAASAKYSSTKDLATSDSKSKLSNYGKKKEEGPPITFNTRYKVTSTRGAKSRDPSPNPDFESSNPVLERISASRDRSRERIANIKEKTREPSPVANKTTRLSRLNSNTSSTGKETPTYNRTVSSSVLTDKHSSSISNLKDKLRDPSPVSRSYYNTISNAREKSRDPSPAASRRNTTASIGTRSRDPSPVTPANKYLSYGLKDKPDPSSTKISETTLHRKLREPSPLTGSSSLTSYKRTSREPSPADFNSKYSSSSLYKMYPKNSTNSSNSSFSSKIGSSSSIPKSPITDLSISYMTTDELRLKAHAALMQKKDWQSQQKANSANISVEKPKPVEMPVEKTIEKVIEKLTNEKPVSNGTSVVAAKKEESEESSSEESESESETESETDTETQPETKIMIQVTTITRATSPTPPGSSYLRTKRQESAKIVEKVRQRPLIGPKSEDKAIQSDRMDDSTRYTRFGNLTRATAVSLNSYSAPRYSSSSSSASKYSISSPRLSRDQDSSTASDRTDKTSISSEKSTSKSEPEKSGKSLLAARVEAARNSSSKSSVKSTSPVKSVPSSTSTSTNKDKLKSPIKSDSSKSDIINDSLSSKLGTLKPASSLKNLNVQTNGTTPANKDFRKSALNMGPAERPRKPKQTSPNSNSNGLDSSPPAPSTLLVESKSSKDIERSSSSSSEASSSSSTTEESPKVQFQEKSSSIPSQTSSDQNTFYKKFESKLDTNSHAKNNNQNSFDTEKAENEKTEQKNNKAFSCFQDTVQFNYKLRHFDSGERPWWLESDESSKTDNKVLEKTNDITMDSKIDDSTQNAIIESQNLKPAINLPNDSLLIENETKQTSRLSQLLGETEPVVLNVHRVQSGEAPWWLKTDSSNKSSSSKKLNKISENKTLNTMWEQDTQADVSELQKDDDITDTEAMRSCDSALSILQLPPNLEHFTMPQSPLGHRLSPDGLEDTTANNKLIEESIPVKNDDLRAMSVRNARDFNAKPKMFISRHTNIDDLLGKTFLSLSDSTIFLL